MRSKINTHIKDRSDCHELLQFKDENSIIHQLRALDSDMDSLSKNLSNVGTVIIANLSYREEHQLLIKSHLKLMEVNQELNQLMQKTVLVFETHLDNPTLGKATTKTKTNWLEVEFTCRKALSRKAYQVFSEYADYIEGLIHWRIGAYFEKRDYAFSIFNNELMLKAIEEESIQNRKIIYEFERVFMLLYQARKEVRAMDRMLVEHYSNIADYKHLIQEYHQLEKNNEQTL